MTIQLDERALLAALRNGSLGGAVLDVFDEEPIPGDSAIWDTPNLLVTAHIAAVSHPELIVPIFLGGTSLLIMVTVSIDFVSQVQTHLMAQQYESLLKRNQQSGKAKRRDTKSSRRSRRIKQDN